MRLKRILATLAATAVLFGVPAVSFGARECHTNAQGVIHCPKPVKKK